VDNDRAFKRIVGYLKKTSPHMVDRVIRYKDKPPLFEASGVDAQIRSTLSRRVDLPSGGYLIFDYAEAFTVIDVNTGRFVGSRGKGSTGRLEDTITKNNLEAVKEVVRQLRLRDIGGIIVIDFIDMANPKNRELVEGALKNELERDRTKTYVVEISPLGLVEMTRQNVTEGPREILTRRCATCEGEGVVLSEESLGIEIERRLRSLTAPGARTQAFKVALHPKVASLIAGPAAERLIELEAQTRRRFFLEGADGVPLDHFKVVSEGKLEDLRPEAPVEEGQELELKLVEVARHDATAAVGKVDGLDVCVGRAAKLVGKKVRVRIERVLDGTAYAVSLDETRADEPITAESEAEKPTRQPRAKKTGDEPAAEAVVAVAADEPEPEPELEPEPEADSVAAAKEPGEEASPAKKRTRRGSRGGRGRKKKPATATTEPAGAQDQAEADAEALDPTALATHPEPPEVEAEAPRTPKIHVPADDLGRDDAEAPGEVPAAENGAPSTDGDVSAAKKRTRRGTRGGRNRRKKTPVEAVTGAAAQPGPVPTAEAEPEAEPEAVPDGEAEWEYVPMSEWEQDITER
jgi:ribonuclease G